MECPSCGSYEMEETLLIGVPSTPWDGKMRGFRCRDCGGAYPFREDLERFVENGRYVEF